MTGTLSTTAAAVGCLLPVVVVLVAMVVVLNRVVPRGTNRTDAPPTPPVLAMALGNGGILNTIGTMMRHQSEYKRLSAALEEVEGPTPRGGGPSPAFSAAP